METTPNLADDLQELPGFGPGIVRDLRELGIFCVADLKGQDPALMYKRLCLIHGMTIDRSVLYQFRCAVYFATEEKHESELLNWWNWADDVRSPN